MKSRTSKTRAGRTSTQVSSRVSRTAAASTVSPISKAPPGRLHRPWFGSAPRLTKRTTPSRNTIAPTAGTGRSGNSFRDDTDRGSRCGPSILRRNRGNAPAGQEIEIVERALVQHVLEDLARVQVARHRNVKARLQICQGGGHGREPLRWAAKRLADMLSHVPHADRHDVSGMGLPEDDGCSLPPLAVQGLPHGEARRVITAADARVRLATGEPLVIPEHDDIAAQRIPQGVRIPRFDQLVPPRSRDHDDQKAVVKPNCLVHADLVDERERLDAIPELLPNRVVDRGDGPAGRHEPAVLLDPERAHAEGPLNLLDRDTAAIQVDDRLLRRQIRIRKSPIQIRVDLQCADIEAAQGRRRAERLDVIVKDDATVRLPGESDLDVRGRRTQGQLAGLLRDSATALHVLHMHAMHPSDELRPEVDDILHRMADPRFRGIEDLRIAVYRRHERADVDLRIPESADEDPRRRRSVHLHPVDHRGGLHHEVPAHEDRAARFAAEELRAAALAAQAARGRRLRGRVEDRRELGRRRLDRDGDHRRATDRERPYERGARMSEAATRRIIRTAGGARIVKENSPLALTTEDRILLYFSDFRNMEERYVLPQALTQKAIAFAAGIQRKTLSRYLDEMVRDGFLTASKAHIEGEKQRMLAYYLAPRGWERAMGIKERLSRVRVPVKVARTTKEMSLEGIDHATSVHLTLSDIVREAINVDELDLEHLEGIDDRRKRAMDERVKRLEDYTRAVMTAWKVN